GQERGSTLACEKDEYGQEQPEHEHQKVLSEEMFAGWLQAGEQYPTRHYGESDACDKAADIGAAQRSGEASAINRLSARRYPGCQLDQTIRNRHEQCRRPRNTDELEFGSGWNQPTGHGGEENDKSQPWQTACKRGMRVHRQRRDDQNQGRPGQQQCDNKRRAQYVPLPLGNDHRDERYVDDDNHDLSCASGQEQRSGQGGEKQQVELTQKLKPAEVSKIYMCQKVRHLCRYCLEATDPRQGAECQGYLIEVKVSGQSHPQFGFSIGVGGPGPICLQSHSVGCFPCG